MNECSVDVVCMVVMAVTWFTLEVNIHESSYRTVIIPFTIETEFGVSSSLETALAHLTALASW